MMLEGGPLTPTSTILRGRMGYAKCQGVLRSLLQMPPVALTDDEADAATSYSLRRWLPSIADAIQLPLEQRDVIGNWCDQPREGERSRSVPIAVRYSSVKL